MGLPYIKTTDYTGLELSFKDAEQRDRLMPLMLEPLGWIKLQAALSRENGANVTDVRIWVDGKQESMSFGEFEDRAGTTPGAQENFAETVPPTVCNCGLSSPMCHGGGVVCSSCGGTIR